MKQPIPLILQRDWMLFSIRWLLLILLTLAFTLRRDALGAPDPAAGLALAFGVGALANFFLALILLVPNAHSAAPSVIILGDLFTAGVFVALSGGDPLLVVGSAGGIMLSGLLRLNAVSGLAHVLGVLAVTVGVLALGDPSINLISPEHLPTMIMLAALAAVAVAGDYALDRQIAEQAKHIVLLARGETAELNHMRATLSALYELSATINSALNYDGVLDAALKAGRLALRDDTGQAYASAILLFRASDNRLHVAAANGLTRADRNQIIRGASGVVGQALREATPVFVDKPTKDPELDYFAAFQSARSLVVVPLRAGYDNYGVLICASDRSGAFDPQQTDMLTAIAYQTTVALQNAVLYSSLLEEKERLVQVEEDARKQLARDLHDGPTQTVAAIAMRMSVLKKMLERQPENMLDELNKVEDIARKTVKEIRHMLFTLRPLVLETQGLTAALQQLAQNMGDTYNQPVVIRVLRDVDAALDAHQQGTLFYVVEEAVNNARKHARADLITVTLTRQGDHVVCSIADNGVGFDLSAVDDNYEKRGSLGMVNMRERAALIDAELQVESAAGSGTTITVYVPLKGAQGGQYAGSGRESATKLAIAAVDRANNRR